MPRFVRCTAEVSCICDELVVLVNLVVGFFRLEDGEMREPIDEYFIGGLECRKAVVGSKVR